MGNHQTNRQRSWGYLSDEDAKRLGTALGEFEALLSREHSLFYWILAGIAATAACICIGLVLGEFWLIVILIILCWPSLAAYGVKSNDRERIDRLAQLMSHCLAIVSRSPENRIFVDDGAKVRDLRLYYDFIEEFPSYRSSKLRYAMKR